MVSRDTRVSKSRSQHRRFVMTMFLFAAAVMISIVAPVGAQPSVVGDWSLASPAQWDYGDPEDPVHQGEAIHAIHLPTKRILLIEDDGPVGSSSTARSYDPVLGTFEPIPITEGDPGPHLLFCAGHALMPDGSVMVAGGRIWPGMGPLAPPWAHIFANGRWEASHPEGDMQYGRFYPTCTALPDGRVLVLGGVDNSGLGGLTVDIPEIYDPATNQWEALENAVQDVGQYPHAFVLPDGRIGVVGANELEHACFPCTDYSITRILDISTQSWTLGPSAGWSGLLGSSAMYAPGKVLRTGGALVDNVVDNIPGQPDNTVRLAATIDLGAANPTWSPIENGMIHARHEHVLVLLPNGHVLAVGGESGDPADFVLNAEWIDPYAAQPEWRELAPMLTGRGHHMSAVLLPDGRVLVAGETEDLGGAYNPRAEIYSPPYLFSSQRPLVATAPAVMNYGHMSTITLSTEYGTPSAEDINRVTLISLGAVTHAFDQNQRLIWLAKYVVNSTTLQVMPPANANMAPPGYYMLFLVSNDGVPSRASYVVLTGPSGI